MAFFVFGTMPEEAVLAEPPTTDAPETPAPTPEPPITTAPIASVARVQVTSDGNEHEAFRHWNHGFSPEMNASGWFKRADEVADELTSFLFNDDFQIIIEGELWRNDFYYYFYKLTDGKWLKVLAVYNQETRKEIFLTHGETWGFEYWEEVFTTDFLELLEPGEYILDVGGWWGNSDAANSYNNFFRFILD